MNGIAPYAQPQKIFEPQNVSQSQNMSGNASRVQSAAQQETGESILGKQNMPDATAQFPNLQQEKETFQAQPEKASVDMGFAIPGGDTVFTESDDKKKKKKDKKSKEKVPKEKPAKEKKGFSLFGKKKKEDSQHYDNQGSCSDFAVPGAADGSEAQSAISGIQSSMAGGMTDKAYGIPEIQPIYPPENAPVAPPTAFVQKENSGIGAGRYDGVKINNVNIGETTVLGNGAAGETVVLSQVKMNNQASPRLTRVRNREQISVNKPVFRIGKEKSYVDYFIGDNPAISRSHANIIIREDGYYIEDTNSTNHTYVNEQMIVSGSPAKLEQNTKIRLGNEEFVFQY